LFFPSSGDIDSPLSGTFDANYDLFLRRIGRLESWDCVWTPPDAVTDEQATRRLADGADFSPIFAVSIGTFAGWV
jgi:hypothetical protein